MKRLRFGFFVLSLTLMAFGAILVTGCSKKEGTEKTAVKVKPDNKVKIVLWHSMGGFNETAVKKIVDDFNASQNMITVEAQFQGTYDDAVLKIRSTPPGQGPDIMQMYDIGTRWMIDSKLSLKMQDFIDADKYDISDYEPNILAYYSIDNSLYSMPFNCSTPVVLYHKEAFAKAGIDPLKDLADFPSMVNASKKLFSSGAVTIGTCWPNYSWIFEQLISQSGKNFANNGNGRASRATAVDFDSNGSGVAILSGWKDLMSLPINATYGKGTAQSKTEFAKGNIGFIADSSSVYTTAQNSAKGAYNVGIAPLPKVSSGDQGGLSVGGGSLWIMDNKSADKAAAAYQFIKFATLPEQQAYWAIATGYLPISKKATETPSFQDYVKNQNPDFMIVINQLRDSKPQYAGALLGVFTKARTIIENEVETMLNTVSVTPQQAIDKISSQINAEIKTYNEANP